MKRILLSILLLTGILSCRKSESQKEIDPNSFFIRLKIDGLSFEVTEKEATGECYMLTSHVDKVAPLKVIELDNNLQVGCPRLPYIRIGILLDSTSPGNSYTIKSGLSNNNSFSLFNNSGSHYGGGETSALPAELTITLTKNEPAGGYIEGTIKGTVVKGTQVTGAPPIYKIVPVEGSFRVLSE